MASGFKTGGRRKGTPNHDRQQLNDMIAERYPGYHPVLALAGIANDSENDIHIRLQANKEVAKYICPQLKAIDITSDIDQGSFLNVSKRSIFTLPDGTEIEI